MVESPVGINHALKEWDVAVQALTEGQTIMLLRKGGIRETNGRFEVPFRKVWLYPTYEHQKPEWLKPDYAHQVHPVEPGWHPDSVEIQSWATVTHVFQVTEAAYVDALYPFHIWTRQFAYERLRWKPRSPLYVLLLRVYCLPDSVRIPFDETYKGCKSWMDFTIGDDHINPSLAAPVLIDENYFVQLEHIQRCLTL